MNPTKYVSNSRALLSLTSLSSLTGRIDRSGAPPINPEQPPPPWYSNWGGFPFGVWPPNPVIHPEQPHLMGAPHLWQPPNPEMMAGWGGPDPYHGQNPDFNPMHRGAPTEYDLHWWAQRGYRGPVPPVSLLTRLASGTRDGARPRYPAVSVPHEAPFPSSALARGAGSMEYPLPNPSTRDSQPTGPDILEPALWQGLMAHHNAAANTSASQYAGTGLIPMDSSDAPQHIPQGGGVPTQGAAPQTAYPTGNPAPAARGADHLYALFDRFRQGSPNTRPVAAPTSATPITAAAAAQPPPRGQSVARDVSVFPLLPPTQQPAPGVPAPTEMPAALRAALMDAGLVTPPWSTFQTQQVRCGGDIR